MKITRLKLVNFIGIKHGTNLDEVEIEFGKKKIVMLNGGNGSGKSTILSQLHPFKDSFDERKTLITEGKDGLKEIDIEHEGNKYEIVHHYGKKAQSFVKKNGTEMNENSGVKTFEAFIESEFGLTSDYFKIGKIGSNTQNFIELTAAERKTYIAKFLPAIQDYQEKFDIVKEKFRVATADIKTVSADLDKLEQEEALKSKIESFESLIKSFDSDIERYSGETAVLLSDIDNITKEISKVDSAAITLDISQKEQKKREIELFAREFVERYKYTKISIEDIEKILSEKAPVISKLNEDIAVAISQKASTNTSLISIENEIKKNEYRLAEISKAGNIDVVNSEIKNVQAKLSKLKESNNHPLFSIVSENQKDISSQMYKFENFKNFVIKYFNNFSKKTIIPVKTNIELFMDEDFDKTLEVQITSIRTLIQNKQASLGMQKSTLGHKETELIKLDKIYKGTADTEKAEICNTCPFVQNAMEYNRLPKDINQLRLDIRQTEKDLAEYELKAEIISEVKNLFQNFKNEYEQMGPRTNKVYSYFVSNYGSLLDNISGNLNDFVTNTSELLAKINSILFSIQEIEKLDSEIENLLYKKNIIENNEAIKKDVKETLDEKKKELEALKIRLKELSDEAIDKSSTLSLETKIHDDHKKHMEGKLQRNSLITMISTQTTLLEGYSKNVESIVTKRKLHETSLATLEDLKKRKYDTNSEMIKTKSLLDRVENLKVKKTALETDYSNLRLLKDALDPNKGVPLYFIKAYLEKTKDITNELLDLAFEGGFEINFYTSDKEFYIQVRAGENVKNDIKEASQGEVALTTISISLALIEQAIGKYNILALDEIDGPLDTTNRSNFISILNKQIEKLGIEQVFVISHNDAFDTEEMDLILLRENNAHQKGADFMKNKEIIFEAK